MLLIGTQPPTNKETQATTYGGHVEVNQGPWPPTPTKLPSGSQKLLPAISLRHLDLCATLVLQPVTHEAELLIQPKWEKNGKYNQ